MDGASSSSVFGAKAKAPDSGSPLRGVRNDEKGVIGKYMAVFLACALTLIAKNAFADAPPQISPAKTMAQAGMIDIRSLAPDIAENIHYAGSDNFTGAPVPGYRAAKCFLLKPAAEALARVDEALRAQHLALKIWDCYRPARAVAAFVRWTHNDDTRTKPEHYPNVDKSKLLGEYIAPVSGHSHGATVDLTMMQCDAHGRHCKPLDMGTHFDMFDPRAHTDSPDVTAAQRANRQRLLHAMAAQGFGNYPAEWWHYTFTMHPQPATLYDVPVQ